LPKRFRYFTRAAAYNLRNDAESLRLCIDMQADSNPIPRCSVPSLFAWSGKSYNVRRGGAGVWFLAVACFSFGYFFD